VKLWFSAPVAAMAPFSVLSFLRDVAAFSEISSVVVDVVFKKMSGHLWYLNQETAALAFFDPNVPIAVKEKMRAALDKPSWEEPKKRFETSPELLRSIVFNDLDFFVSEKSLSFFEKFSIPTDFLRVDAASWENQDSCRDGVTTVQSIQVVNDVAERAVALSQDFQNILTNSDSQRDNIMLVLSEHRQLYPDFKKATLAKDFEP